MSANFSSTAVGVQPRGVQQQAMLQRHLQTVKRERRSDVRVDAMLQLMMNGTDAKFTLERAKYRFDLCQLHVTRHSTLGSPAVRLERSK